MGDLAVDGFTDLTPTQLEMLSLMATGSRRVLITLPLAGPPADTNPRGE